jgi:DNA-binding Lrp family transcriptional regulator
MILGFILIKLTPEKYLEAIKELMKIKTIATYELFGEYDFLLIVEVETNKELRNMVLGCIRRIQGVRSTKTLIGSHPIPTP